MQNYCGVAPVTERSGKQHWVHWRFKSSKIPRQTFVEWAALTIPRSYWASEFYKSQRARGATHQAALRALAFKWARILFRCWKDRTTYDESRYLKHLKFANHHSSQENKFMLNPLDGPPQGVSWVGRQVRPMVLQCSEHRKSAGRSP